MKNQCIGTGTFKSHGKFNGHPGCILPARAKFNGYRNRYGLAHRRHNPGGKIRIFQYCSAAIPAADAAIGASKIDIDTKQCFVFDPAGCLRHDVGIIPDGLSVVNRATGAAIYQENGVFRSPIWSDGTVYVAGGLRPHLQVLTARDPLGNVLWQSSKVVGRGTGSPALGHGVVVLASEWTIDGYSAADGSTLWTHQQGFQLYDMYPNRRDQKQSVCAPAIADSVVYVGSLDGHLYALDLATGTELWKWYFGTPVASSPALSGNMLYVGASDGHLYGFVSSDPSAVSSASETTVPVVFTLSPPRPNPARSTVRIEWSQPQAAGVRIEIFDVRGRRVRLLVDEFREASEHSVVWDGRQGGGELSASGVYFVRVQAGDSTRDRKFVYLRW